MSVYSSKVLGNKVMPMLINFNTPQDVVEAFDEPTTYDDVRQFPLEMRSVCTRCARHTGTTRRGGKAVSHSDLKNENDDTKIVR